MTLRSNYDVTKKLWRHLAIMTLLSICDITFSWIVTSLIRNYDVINKLSDAENQVYLYNGVLV